MIDKAIEIMGREPLNPIGECFESVGFSVVHHLFKEPILPDDSYVCHGIGVANMPGQEGNVMGHAWIEGRGGRMAMDTTWGVATQAEHYRKQVNIEYVVTYTLQEFMDLWHKHDNPGPWDEKIRAITDKASCTHAKTVAPSDIKKSES